MRSTKVFNNISDKLRAEIPKLKPGQIVKFKMLNGVPNPEPDEKERSKSPMLYGKVEIQTNFKIYDPYQDFVKDIDGNPIKDDKGAVQYIGGYVDVGCVDQWNGEYPSKFRFFVPGMAGGSQFQGFFTLSADNIKEVELYEILWLSNEREGNPHRDLSVTPMFKIEDLKTETKGVVGKVERLKKAIKLAEEIKPAKARQVMARLNLPNYQDDEILLLKIKDFALTNYELFLSTYENPDIEVQFIIQSAMESGVLSHDIQSGKISMGNVQLGILKMGKGGSFPEEFSQWLKTSENGQDILSNIRGQLSQKSVPNV